MSTISISERIVTPGLVIASTLVACLGVVYIYTIYYLFKEYKKRRRRTFDETPSKRDGNLKLGDSLITSSIQRGPPNSTFSNNEVDAALISGTFSKQNPTSNYNILDSTETLDRNSNDTMNKPDDRNPKLCSEMKRSDTFFNSLRRHEDSNQTSCIDSNRVERVITDRAVGVTGDTEGDSVDGRHLTLDIESKIFYVDRHFLPDPLLSNRCNSISQNGGIIVIN